MLTKLKEIRTENKNMHICDLVVDENSNYYCHVRRGQKEDLIPLEEFYKKVELCN